jgi:hypothetical protein
MIAPESPNSAEHSSSNSAKSHMIKIHGIISGRFGDNHAT